MRSSRLSLVGGLVLQELDFHRDVGRQIVMAGLPGAFEHLAQPSHLLLLPGTRPTGTVEIRREAPNLWISETRVTIVWDEPMPGAGRPWFLCACSRRARYLYLRDTIRRVTAASYQLAAAALSDSDTYQLPDGAPP